MCVVTSNPGRFTPQQKDTNTGTDYNNNNNNNNIYLTAVGLSPGGSGF
jgi:hypothetical protein